ncbi:MAG: hypothetical protein ACK5NF_07925 [Bacilli bacterium]
MKKRIITILTLFFISTACSNNAKISDEFYDVANKNEYKDLYEINELELKENELNADETLWDNVAQFKSGFVFNWKKSSSNDTPSILYFYEVEDKKARKKMLEMIKNNEVTHMNISKKNACEYQDKYIMIIDENIKSNEMTKNLVKKFCK